MPSHNIKVSKEIFASLTALGMAHKPLQSIPKINKIPSTTNLQTAQTLYEQELVIDELFKLFEQLIEKDKNDAVLTVAEYFEIDELLEKTWKALGQMTQK